MPEIRYDALAGAFTIIATERAKRPLDFGMGSDRGLIVPETDPKCPFCPGNEAETPPEIWAKRGSGETDVSNWTVRVVPNKFPALVGWPEGEGREEGQRLPPFPETPDAALYWQAPGVGHHEVVVESPKHNGTLGSYSPEQTKDVLEAIKLRSLDLYDKKEVAYVQVFKNSGKTAGASLAHPHFQIIALPVTPSLITQEGQRLKEYEAKTRRCLVCDTVLREVEKDVRVILKTSRFAVLSPFASRYSYETMIVPLEHIAGLTEMGGPVLADLAGVLTRLFRAYESMFSALPFNMVFHGVPASVRDRRGWPYHAHIHVYPRLNTEAGLEIGSGSYINPTPPELATREFASVICD